MKKFIFVLFSLSILLIFSGCQKEVKPPMTYDELLSYKGTNESLYKYLLLTAAENRELFDAWMVDMDYRYWDLIVFKKIFVRTNKAKKIALLYLFKNYYYSLDNKIFIRDNG